MSLAIRATELLSRQIRSRTTGNGEGLRRITNLFGLAQESQEEGGFLERIWDSTKALVGWAGNVLGVAKISVSACWGWLVSRIESLKAFDWNATDAELEQQIHNRNIQLASLWGGVSGQAVGWLAGIAIGYGISYLCPVIGGASLAKATAGAVSEEAAQELSSALRNAVKQTANVLASSALSKGYMLLRSGIQSLPIDRLSKLIGEERAAWVKFQWGSEDGANLSFNNIVDEAVESIDNDLLRAFTEEFLDESWEAFTEAGFIVAQEWDSAFEQAKKANEKALGTDRTVVLYPDRESEEAIAFQAMPQKMLETQVQTALVQHRLVANRDIGQWVGEPYQERIKAEFQLRKLTIQFSERPAPPWRMQDGRRPREAVYNIPDVKRGLTWQEIKTAAEAYTWGPWCARARLNNQRQMAVYGATAQEAQTKLEKLMTLTTAEPLKVLVSYEEQVPTRMRKEPTQMYPVWCTLLARTQSLDQNGRVDLNNRIFDEQVHKIPLWYPTEPDNIPQIL